MFLYRQFTLQRKLLGRISDNESILVGMVYHQSQIGVKGADGRASQLARILESLPSLSFRNLIFIGPFADVVFFFFAFISCFFNISACKVTKSS